MASLSALKDEGIDSMSSLRPVALPVALAVPNDLIRANLLPCLDSRDFQKVKRVCKQWQAIKAPLRVHANLRSKCLEGLDKLAQLESFITDFEGQGCKIVSMDLSSAQVSNAPEVWGRLGKIASLEHLILSSARILDEDRALLKQFVSLKSLDLTNTYTALCKLPDLSNMTSLEHLNLSHNFIIDQEISCLKIPPSLTKLNLYGNTISEAGLPDLEAHAIKECDLGDNDIPYADRRSFYIRGHFHKRLKVLEGDQRFSTFGDRPSQINSIRKIGQLITEYEGTKFSDLTIACQNVYGVLCGRITVIHRSAKGKLTFVSTLFRNIR